MVEIDENGEPIGYFADLARLIAKEVSLPLEFRQYHDGGAFSAAVKRGEVTFYAGMPRVVGPDLGLLSSDPLSPMRFGLFTRFDHLEEIDTSFVGQQSVGFYRAMSFWTGHGLPGNLTQEVFDHVNGPPVALLSGDVDMIFMSEQTLSNWSYRTGLDHLFAAIPGTTVEYDRVVGLTQSRSDVMPAINAAIKRLKNKGALRDLRRAHHMHLFDPPPEELTVGVLHYPPFQFVQDDGTFGGFGVEVFRDLAEAAGLRYRFQEITVEDVLKWSDEMGVDILPMVSRTPERSRGLDFTLPIYEVPVSLYVRKEDLGLYSDRASLDGKQLGVLDPGQWREVEGFETGAKLRLLGSPPDLVSALQRKEVDAIAADQFLIERVLSERRLDDQVILLETVYVSSQAIAMRYGLGRVRTQLNNAIPHYILSQQFNEHRRILRGDMEFWTEERKRIAYAAIILFAMLLCLMGIVATLNYRARKQAEALTAVTQDVSSRLSAVLEAAKSGILAFNRKGEIAIANTSARRMLGVGDRPIPFAWPDNVVFASRDGSEEMVPKPRVLSYLLNKDPFKDKTLRLVTRGEAEFRYVLPVNSLIAPEASPQIGSVLILDDVTELVSHREQVERAGRLSAIGQLTGGVAHDFNNLLAVILGNLELLKDENPSKKINDYANAALAATKRGADLTRSMLAFARQSSLQPEVINLNTIVRDADSWIGRTLPETVEIKAELEQDLWAVEVDRGATESAFLNLLVNARDAMEERGTLTIETRNLRIDEELKDERDTLIQPGRYVMLAVSDTGHGIAKEHLAKIYDPFFSTKEVGKGTGLGLSMVMGFMQQSGGTIQVLSEPGQGSTFKLLFPVAEDATKTDEIPSSEQARSDTGPNRILLVEDEEAVRKIIVSVLSRVGYQVTEAKNGDEAFELFQRDPNFDVLLTDIVMPGQLQGVQLAQEIRGQRPDLPVIFISGYSNEIDSPGQSINPNDIRLMKPVQRADLLRVLDEAMGKNGPSTQEQ